MAVTLALPPPIWKEFLLRGLCDATAKLNDWKQASILDHAKDFKEQEKGPSCHRCRVASQQRVKERALTPSPPCYTTLLVKLDNLKHWYLDQQKVGNRRLVFARQQFHV